MAKAQTSKAKVLADKVAAAKAGKGAGGDGSPIMVSALSVVSKREGFRRGGRAWGANATVVKLSDLTNEQIARIMDEPMLEVEEIEVEEGAA